MIVAVPVAAVLIIATILAILAVSSARQEAHGRHARHARAFADPADATDPDGEQFIAELHHEPLPLGVLARVRDKLRELDTVPRFHSAPGCEEAPADPDVTVRLPHAVGTWGKTPHELADELARRYLEVTR
jgi:hypothetical protein